MGVLALLPEWVSLLLACSLLSRLIDLSHEDLADRLLAGTARVLDLTLVTADRRLSGCDAIEVLVN